MATYKKQLLDKDGNVIYPDVGLELDNVVYSDDPTEVATDIIDPINYSLDEKWTGGYWINGKKIYKKTVATGALPSSATYKTINPNITNLEQVISLDGYFKNNDGTITFPINTSSLGGGTAYFRTYILNGDVIVNVGMDRSAFSGYVTLYYTKTTDD